MSASATTTPVLFGEYLGKFVKLSAHDVSEIMEHQAATRRRFGEIALAWGLCRPQHVWQAWWDQLSRHTPTVQLTKIGIDAQAISHMPADIAYQFRAVPVRAHRDQLVVATCDQGLPRAQAELSGLLNKHIRFVLTNWSQLDEALAAYYPKKLDAAGAA